MHFLKEEVVLLCAQDVRRVRDLYWAQRLVDEQRTTKQVETEWKMCRAAVPFLGNLTYLDPTNFKKLRNEKKENAERFYSEMIGRFVREKTICYNWNAKGCGGGCGLRHVCMLCRGEHPSSRCKKKR
jgi:hypothetical protein